MFPSCHQYSICYTFLSLSLGFINLYKSNTIHIWDSTADEVLWAISKVGVPEGVERLTAHLSAHLYIQVWQFNTHPYLEGLQLEHKINVTMKRYILFLWDSQYKKITLLFMAYLNMINRSWQAGCSLMFLFFGIQAWVIYCWMIEPRKVVRERRPFFCSTFFLYHLVCLYVCMCHGRWGSSPWLCLSITMVTLNQISKSEKAPVSFLTATLTV